MRQDIVRLILVLTVTVGLGAGSDVPYVFGDDGPQPLDYAHIEVYNDTEPLAFSTTGGPGASGAGDVRTISDLREELSGKVDVTDPSTRETAVVLAAKYPGDRTIEQICSVYKYLKEGWRYVSDPSGIDYYQSASESIRIGEKADCAGAGDCDDFAILMSALIESIGGTARIVLAYNQSDGHAYTEVYLGRIGQDQAEQIVEWLKQKYNVGEIYTHIDSDTEEVWLNLDWSSNHPGGPFYRADKQVVILVRGGGYEKVPLNLVTWMRIFGEGWASSVQQTSDGGYVIAGGSDNYGAWLAKTDDKGNRLWYKNFGGITACEVQQTSDGGYIIAGDCPNFAWLIKTDANGNKLWERTLGKGPNVAGSSVKQTNDGGYILAGWTSSFFPQLNPSDPSVDVFLIKTDANGYEVWNRTFGGSEVDLGYSVLQTGDGGYILSGSTQSYAIINSYEDIRMTWLIKTDSVGNKKWDKILPGYSGCKIRQTSDGGYILGGTRIGASSLIKTNSIGNMEWVKFSNSLDTKDVQQTRDGGYLTTNRVLIEAESTDTASIEEWNPGLALSRSSSHTSFLIKIDAKGNEEWRKELDYPDALWNSILQATDGGYVLAGLYNGYATLLKTDANVNA